MSSSSGARVRELLVRPFTVKNLSLPNRVVMSPMTRDFSPGGVPGADVAAYYARRAAGGVGLIITEGTYVGHGSAGTSDRVPRFHGTESLAGWREVTAAVHQAGGRIFAQLWHVGMVRTEGAPPVPAAPRIGPSGIPVDAAGPGRAMTQQDIDDVVAAFAAGAAAAEQLGFDGVEIHAAHGYLIDQFLWSHTNRRTDAYGGDLAGRTRFATEIVAAVRAATSPQFPVGIRLSQWKTSDYQAKIARSPQELEALLAPLADAGADLFHLSTRRFAVPEFDGSDLNLAGWAKKLSGLPVITVGSVGLDNMFNQVFEGQQANVADIGALLDRLERDEFDLVAVGRALLGDPEWFTKILNGRTAELKPFDVTRLGTLF